MFKRAERKRHPILTGTISALTVIGTCRLFTVMKEAFGKMKCGFCRKKSVTEKEEE